MKVLSTEPEIAGFLRILSLRSEGFSPDIEQSVRAIVDDVRIRGDDALALYTGQFDRHDLPFPVPENEITAAAKNAPGDVMKAIEHAAERIRRFHELQREKSWTIREGSTLLGQIIRPLARVGVYVPGGKASYPSTVLMNVIPAQVAGVGEIAVAVPSPDGVLNPVVMAALRVLDVKEVYRIGGAQAIAAFAYGTQTIRKTDKITGPGNAYVATAKRLVFGVVDIDMIAGPSEILIIADETADPRFVAADMLGQAEHDEMASSVVITDSAAFAETLAAEIERMLKKLPRKNIADASLSKYGAIIKVPDIRNAVSLANEIAPEHLQIMISHPQKLLGLIRNAGAIFLGSWTPESLGDYAAGPNHTLPTSGTARFFSPLGVYDFIKRTSLLSFSPKGFDALAGTVRTLAECEGLDAHALTVAVRMESREKPGKKKPVIQ